MSALGGSAPARPRRSLDLAIGAAITAAMAAIALASLFWAPWNAELMQTAPALAAPSAAHPFGVDAYGRDVLSRVMVGSRSALAVALAAAGIGVGVGAPLGLAAAAFGGWLDEAVMRASDLVFAFPALLIAVLMSALLGPGALNAVIAIGVFNIPVFARVARASALQLWTREFVMAAQMAGKGRFRISLEHVAPNLAGTLVVQGAIQLSLAVVADAGLAYVGLGAQPPAPSWGRMLADAQTMAGSAPWLVLFPGGAIVVTVLGLSLLGEGLRARLDPRAVARSEI
jgi:peptide/nickel transport system permease protein